MQETLAVEWGENDLTAGQEMHDLCCELFPICRSITGDGLRQSLSILKKHLPDMHVVEVPSGTKCFDWEVPQEWNIRDAYIIDPDGKKICDFKKSNLHLVGYSIPVNKSMSLDELQQHLYSLPEQPDAIPYITSYYNRHWGFCLTDKERLSLKRGEYTVYIDSELKDGSLSYAELIIPGETSEEIFLSTCLCHPSMANNELSGPVVTTFLAKWISELTHRRYTYRIIIIPETIGSIVYLSQHLAEMKNNIVAGFNVVCVGDEGGYSFLPSRKGDTLADKVAVHVLKHSHPEYVTYSFLDRGSDERQYCSPGVDLPVCSVMRSKYDCYPEYHTSLDDMSFVTPDGLEGGYDALKEAIECIEKNEMLRTTICCEPQLGKRGLYPTVSTKDSRQTVKDMMNLLAYADGSLSVFEIAEKIEVPMRKLTSMVETLKAEGILEACVSA